MDLALLREVNRQCQRNRAISTNVNCMTQIDQYDVNKKSTEVPSWNGRLRNTGIGALTSSNQNLRPLNIHA